VGRADHWAGRRGTASVHGARASRRARGITVPWSRSTSTRSSEIRRASWRDGRIIDDSPGQGCGGPPQPRKVRDLRGRGYYYGVQARWRHDAQGARVEASRGVPPADRGGIAADPALVTASEVRMASRAAGQRDSDGDPACRRRCRTCLGSGGATHVGRCRAHARSHRGGTTCSPTSAASSGRSVRYVFGRSLAHERKIVQRSRTARTLGRHAPARPGKTLGLVGVGSTAPTSPPPRSTSA
jgi:hypothetical protein